ncbi:MAG: DUF86 domain-containing protein [archaeon]|nr:DUF86 domain-containing protein [archaeon]
MVLFDEEKITKLTSELFKAVGKLKELAALSEEGFIRDPHKVASAKYFLIVAIEAAIDLCNHVISRNKFRVPNDYADTFRVMEEVGFFSKEFVERLVEMAKFRNRLVHIYWEVDDEVIYDIIRDDIRDIEVFVEAFMKVLREKGEAG